ncbi:unnamed protein product [Dracunculus medinensis]|uniref:ShKT domain-containing protein n=1 Tax=Dracunculus medinensis TaxID=318479 RepID=A0A0N4UFZ9_DRAME|nr:unnamed protein product [Dracunculus medinensis]
MLFLLVALLFVKKGESGEGMKLTKCLDPNTGAIARPLPLPSACKDKDPVICNAIFSPRVPDIPNNAVATNDFYVSPNCVNATVMANAEALCPSSCAVCCLTPEFNCQNSAANCNAFMLSPDLCINPNTAAAALAGCPRACGLCNRPGANGQCPDTGVVNCGQLLATGLNCSNAFMTQNCMGTCRITTCLSTTAAASACSDSRADCARLASYCNIPPYSTVMVDQCKRTCNLCR